MPTTGYLLVTRLEPALMTHLSHPSVYSAENLKWVHGALQEVIPWTVSYTYAVHYAVYYALPPSHPSVA